MANLTFMNHTIFDHGASAQLGQVLMQHGIRRPLLCTDKGLVNLGLVTDLVANLGNDAALTIYDGTPENPTQVSVEEATAKYLEADCDGVVAFGGGSSMDLAKAVALAVTHTGKLIDYTAGLGGAAKIQDVAPLIAIPTTSGTGSEVSSGAVIIMKKLVSYDSPPTCSFYLHVFVALIYFPFVIFNWQQPSLNLWLMLIGMGFCGGIAQILLTNAYRLSTVNLLQPFDYTAIIWAITFGLIFFNDYPDRYVIIGSIVIVISTYYIIYRETKVGQNLNSLKTNNRQI